MELQKRILLVDDESSIRRTLSLGLAQHGYDTESCMDGVSALVKINTLVKAGNTPSAVVIDIQLPDILGTKLARIINFKYPNIPIFLITGYSSNLNPTEIQDLRIRALLNKPVTSDELVENFKNIIVDKVETKVETPKVEESISSYLLVNFKKDENFFDTYRQLYYKNNVVYCDATKGEYDVLMLVQGDTKEELNNVIENDIMKTNGVESVETLHMKAPILSESMEDVINMAEGALASEATDEKMSREMSNQVCSYVLMEVENDKVEKIYPTLKLNDNIVYCDHTNGSYNLVLFHHGSFYSDVDKFIEKHILNLDGVVRVKKFPVVNMFGM